MENRYEVVIVGAGLAGLAAADVLAHRGLSVLVVDENPHSGGQLLRTSPGKKKFSPDGMKKRGLALVNAVKQYGSDAKSGIELVSQAQVMGIFKENSGYSLQILDGGKIHEPRCESILLATGARERYLPFKGWTLPGVISLGAAQILMKGSGVLPAASTLIAGTSPLQMALAAEILSNGGRVSAILDENPRRESLNFLPLLLGRGAVTHWAKALEGAWYTARLSRVPHHYRRRIKEALGDGELEAVVTVKTDAQGRAIAGTEKTYATRALAVGCGFVPNGELAVQAGCRMVYGAGGWVLDGDDRLESSCPGIFGAGEITGVAGGKKSFIEGRLAGLSLVERLGAYGAGEKLELNWEQRRLIRARRVQEDYGRFLNRLCRLPRAAWAEIPDSTVICRCEGVTMGTLRQRVAQGFNTATALKRSTRTGMGRCQGRICSPMIQDILGVLAPEFDLAGSHPSLRAPVKNSPIGAYLED